jgi:hypothetical protein
LTSPAAGYLTAFFNSKLFKFTFKDYFPELLGETRELRKVFFETVTVKPFSRADIFNHKVKSIEQNKSQGLPTVVLEKQIDELLFEHYNLTDSEIAIIERSVSLSGLSDNSINLTSASVSV